MDNKLIFVVDDEPSIAETLALILREKGYVAFPFLRPFDAIEAIKKLGIPDGLITDFNMPEMDGLTLAAMMNGMFPHCRVLILTGVPQLMEAHPDRDRFTCLVKPLPMPVLLEAVSQLFSENFAAALA